jgi:hypothetical protein
MRELTILFLGALAAGGAVANEELDRKLDAGRDFKIERAEPAVRGAIAPTGPNSVYGEVRSDNIRGRAHIDTRTGNGSVHVDVQTDF